MNENETPTNDSLNDDGVYWDADIEQAKACSTCDNSGEIECLWCEDGFLYDDEGAPITCTFCGGEGFVDCPDCVD